LRACPAGTWQNSLEALRRPDRLFRNYLRLVRGCDALFLRGTSPLIWSVHWMAGAYGRRVVHWFGANPYRVVAAERRGYSPLTAWAGMRFASFERAMTRWAAVANGSYVIANGAEIAGLYRSGRTIEVVSTSITESDFLVRTDPCTKDVVRILFVGFIRAEKGIEFLIRALPLIKSRRPVHLALVGSWDQFPTEYERLRGIIHELNLEERVSWEGYAAFGRELFAQMDRSDLLAAPSLSEGTPRVLVEARARSLPIVSTRVGGIPTSVTAGEDGLLVPPRDPQALAHAISCIINDAALRQRLIHNGRERVRQITIERFVDLIMQLLTCPDLNEAGNYPLRAAPVVPRAPQR
jgi:glycosyltransferase involved in cell wall biosynthesis